MRTSQIAVAIVLAAGLLGASLEAVAQEDSPSIPNTTNTGGPRSESDLPANTDEETPHQTDGIEEIVIKSSSDLTSLQQESVSVTEFSADELDAMRMQDLRDVSKYTPNLEIKSSFAVSNPTLFIRGVGINDLNANSAGSVSIYADGVQMVSPAIQLSQFFDLAGVDVLRGPQGTIYRNASAGAIIIKPRLPSGDFGSSLQVTAGNYDALDISGAVEMPVVPGLLSVRAAFKTAARDGYTKNRCHGNDQCAVTVRPISGIRIPKPADNPTDPNVAKWVNDRDNWGARAILRLTPDVAEMEWIANVHFSGNDGQAAQWQHVAAGPESRDLDDPRVGLPCDPSTGRTITIGGTERTLACLDASDYNDPDSDPFAGDYDEAGKEELDTRGVTLNGSAIVGNFLLKSISGYEWHDRVVDQNVDSNPNKLLNSTLSDEATQLSQELVADWDDGGELRWAFGGSLLYEDLSVDNSFSALPNISVLGGPIIGQEIQQDTTSFGIYGKFAWDLLADITIDGGLRYSWERKAFDITTTLEFLRVDASLESFHANEEESWSAPSGGIGITYRPVEDVSFYVKYARGWKSGAWNGGAIDPVSLATAVNPESVDSFEIGMKSQWFDQRMTFNMSGFYYDYKDLQVFTLERAQGGVPLQQLVNAESATIYGIELDMVLIPLANLVRYDQLIIAYNFGYLESRYNKFVDTFTKSIGRPPRGTEIVTDYSGNRLVASPQFSWSGSVSYELPFFQDRFGMISARYDFSYKDDIFFHPSEGTGILQSFSDKYTVGQEAYWLHNFRIGYRDPSERFEIAGWVQNMFDKEYKVDALDISEGFGLVAEIYGEPRTYGVTVDVNF